jgi:hypothetical protein
MANYLKSHGPNEYRHGRKTAYSIPDMLDRGQAELEKAADGVSAAAADELEEVPENDPEDEDIIVEL